jgi:hypothetical protein
LQYLHNNCNKCFHVFFTFCTYDIEKYKNVLFISLLIANVVLRQPPTSSLFFQDSVFLLYALSPLDNLLGAKVNTPMALRGRRRAPGKRPENRKRKLQLCPTSRNETKGVTQWSPRPPPEQKIVGSNQGDQIGRIFAQCVGVFLGHILTITKKQPTFLS